MDGGGIPATPPLIGAGTSVLRAWESPQSPNLWRVALRSMNSRNPDGGFGESTLACLNDGQRGRGTGTRTQTVRVLESDHPPNPR